MNRVKEADEEVGFDVCGVNDLEDNSMKAFDILPDKQILLIKQNNRFSALGNVCPHYGVLMSAGVLAKGRLRCKAHGACFNASTGDIEDFPGLDSLPCYQVMVDKNGRVRVKTKRKNLSIDARVNIRPQRCYLDGPTFIVIGGGVAGQTCVETLRSKGFTGRVVLLSSEGVYPYDRVQLSKIWNLDLKDVEFRNTEFYEKYGIDVYLETRVTSINIPDKTIDCSNGCSFSYDKIFIATGSKAIIPPLPGVHLKNVLTLRDFLDYEAIRKVVSKKINVVCLGSGFISMEIASTLQPWVKSITIVSRGELPLGRIFGAEICQQIKELFEEHDITFHVETVIEEILGVDGKVSEVKLSNGTILPCDLLIMGVGGEIETDFLKGTAFQLNTDGTLNVDKYLMTNVSDVFAGGDVANATIHLHGSKRFNFGHIQIAQYHGSIAAMNMIKKSTPIKAVPFFWTRFFGITFRLCGISESIENIEIIGDLKNFSFVAYYFNSEAKVIGVISCGDNNIAAVFAELCTQSKVIYRTDIETDDAHGWTKKIYE